MKRFLPWALGVALVMVAFFSSRQLRQANERIDRLELTLATDHRNKRYSVLTGVETGPERSGSETELRQLRAATNQMREQIRALRSELDAFRARTSTGTIPEFNILPSGLVGARGPIERWEGGPKRNWGHEQAAGEPDTTQAGDISTAWAPKRPDAGEEWLQLEYEEAVDISQINVIESYNPGAISKVTALTDAGEEIVVWEGTLDQENLGDQVVVTEFGVSQSVNAKTVKVYLDTARVAGWNEIDAVQLLGTNGVNQWATASSASSSYAD